MHQRPQHHAGWDMMVCSVTCFTSRTRPRTLFQRAALAPYLYFCFLNSVSISVHLCDLACMRLHTSSGSSKPNTSCFRKLCKCRGERNKHVTKRVKGQREVLSVMCCQDWTNFGTLAVGMDDDRALVHSLHKPVRQLLFQSSVKFNLRSADHVFSQTGK